MLQLRYSLERSKHEYATVMGDPFSISNLYWQLTRNHDAQDGTAIGDVRVFNMKGQDVTDSVLNAPHAGVLPACTIQR